MNAVELDLVRIEAWICAAQQGTSERSFAVDYDPDHETFTATAYVEGAVFALGGGDHLKEAIEWLAFRLSGTDKPQQKEAMQP